MQVQKQQPQILDLIKKFKAGLKWIEEGYVKLGWTSGRRIYDPTFEQDIKIFEDEVVKPMDEAWSKLSDDEKDKLLETMERGKK